MNRIIVYVILVVLALLVTFFGLGPVLLADGSNIERMITLFVVVVLYLILFAIFYLFHKRWKK